MNLNARSSPFHFCIWVCVFHYAHTYAMYVQVHSDSCEELFFNLWNVIVHSNSMCKQSIYGWFCFISRIGRINSLWAAALLSILNWCAAEKVLIIVHCIYCEYVSVCLIFCCGVFKVLISCCFFKFLWFFYLI